MLGLVLRWRLGGLGLGVRVRAEWPGGPGWLEADWVVVSGRLGLGSRSGVRVNVEAGVRG